MTPKLGADLLPQVIPALESALGLRPPQRPILQSRKFSLSHFRLTQTSKRIENAFETDCIVTRVFGLFCQVSVRLLNCTNVLGDTG